MQQKTLLFLVRPAERRVLLALKKRGFGEGKWNGVGGKVEPGESIEAAAVREAHEEIGVTLAPADLLSRGVISFSFAGMSELTQDVHVFLAEHWQGVPDESEEMRPRWYTYDTVPYGAMWVDDAHWLPQVLAGGVVRARFHFAATGDEILEQEVRVGSEPSPGGY